MFFISFSSANLGTYKQGENVTVRGDLNATSVNVTIYYPDTTIAINNKPMTNIRGDIWGYNFSGTSDSGIYVYDYCNQDGDNCKENTFEINLVGKELTTSRSILYIVLFIILIFLFVVDAFIIGSLPSGNPKNEYNEIISISWKKYLRTSLMVFAWGLIIAILLISSSLTNSYLGESGISDFLFKLFKVFSSWQVIILVLILWFFSVIWNMMKDFKIKGLFDRGFFPRGEEYG